MVTDNTPPPTLPPDATAIDMGGDDAFKSLALFLTGRHGVQDPDTGDSYGSIFEGWPTTDGWDYALQVQRANAERANAEIAKMRGEQPELTEAITEAVESIVLTIELPAARAQELVQAAMGWMDHGCAEAVPPMADIACLMAEAIVEHWGRQAAGE